MIPIKNVIDEQAIEMMFEYGNNFVQSLAQMFCNANDHDRLKIKTAWPGLFAEYSARHGHEENMRWTTVQGTVHPNLAAPESVRV